MQRKPWMTCKGASPISKNQVIAGNIFRAKLGIGLSLEEKKGPQFKFVPGVGLVQIACCQVPIQRIRNIILDCGTPSFSGPTLIDCGTPSTNGEILDCGKA